MEKYGDVKLQESELKIFAVLWKSGRDLSDSEKKDIDKHIKITYRAMYEDWNRPSPQIYNEGQSGGKQCEINDLGKDP